jgi:hypothetical protein
MIARLLALVLALALLAPASAASGDESGAYAVHVTVTPAPGSSLQRVNLPASVLVAARNADLADVRIFNGEGKPVPIARSTAPAVRRRRTLALPVMPILGPEDSLGAAGISLRIENSRGASVVRVDGSPQSGGTAKLLGVLLDTRRIADPVAGLSLELTTPTGQPVTFTIEHSADLDTWEPLAAKVVYHAAPPVGSETIGFPEQDLRGRYVRVTWQSTSQLLAPVTVKSSAAVVIHASASGPAPRAVLSVPADPRTIEFTLPFAAPVAALEIVSTGEDMVVPVRILGRNEPEQPWTPLATGSVFRVTGTGEDRANPAFDLRGTRLRTLRIEADARSAGFTAPPRIAARFAPVQLLFLASGPGPYTLAAGRAGAQAAFLPAGDLAQASGVAPSAAPLATIAGAADPVVAALAADEGTPWRRWTLWAVLLAGTALLAAMVWLLVRNRDRAA